MTGDTEHIMMTLFGTGKLEEVPIHQLKELVQTFPSFNIGHYLLSKRLEKEKDEESRAANLKTALYFNNPFWLQWLLQNTNEEQKGSVENNPVFSDGTRSGFSFDYPRREQPRSWETDLLPGQEQLEKEGHQATPVSRDYSERLIHEESPVENLVKKEESWNPMEGGESDEPSSEVLLEDSNPSITLEQVLIHSVNLENSPKIENTEVDMAISNEAEFKKRQWQEDESMKDISPPISGRTEGPVIAEEASSAEKHWQEDIEAPLSQTSQTYISNEEIQNLEESDPKEDSQIEKTSLIQGNPDQERDKEGFPHKETGLEWLLQESTSSPITESNSLNQENPEIKETLTTDPLSEKDWQEALAQLKILEQRAAELRSTESIPIPGKEEELSIPESGIAEPTLSEFQTFENHLGEENSETSGPVNPEAEASYPVAVHQVETVGKEEISDAVSNEGVPESLYSPDAVISGSKDSEQPNYPFEKENAEKTDDETPNPISILHEVASTAGKEESEIKNEESSQEILPGNSGPSADEQPDLLAISPIEVRLEEKVETANPIQILHELSPIPVSPELSDDQPVSLQEPNSEHSPLPEKEPEEPLDNTPAEVHSEEKKPEMESPINNPQNEVSGLADKVLPVEEIKPAIPQAEAPLFDPYHTIDYFASQGIKFVYQENPSDKFGKQLKSFTDWLKIMKRLPQKQVVAAIEQNMDSSSIESFAAHSLDEKDTLTETMATVLAKQGKNDKAIEIYQKLSLLNPSKNAYFAARIEELKN